MSKDKQETVSDIFDNIGLDTKEFDVEPITDIVIDDDDDDDVVNDDDNVVETQDVVDDVTEQTTTDKIIRKEKLTLNKTKLETPSTPTKLEDVDGKKLSVARFANEFLKEDDKGNLVSENGIIVARSGTERQIYTDMKALYHETDSKLASTQNILQQLMPKTKELYKKFVALEQEKSYGDHLGVDKKEVKEAIDLAAYSKQHGPLAMVKKLLTTLQMQGHDIKSLGIASQTDGTAIADLVNTGIKDALKPYTDKTEQEEDAEKAQKVAQEFLGNYPEAKEHIPQIIEAKQAFPEMSLEAIWYKLDKAIRDRATATTPVVEKEITKPVSRSNTSRRKSKTKLSNRPASSNQSFEDIGEQLLRDLS